MQQFQSHSDSGHLGRTNRVPKIFVSEELIYRSICGHAPDRSKVFQSEYALLSRIAAARGDGILQGDLGRLTGQDKRSVPKRTDALQAKGYIVKQPIHVKGVNTSLLILRRYATNIHNSSNTSAAVDAFTFLDSPNDQKLLVRHVVWKLGNALSDGSLVELEKLLGLLEEESETAKKVLSRIIRPLEKAGTLKRVKTAFGPAAHAGDLKTYVQQIRLPSEADLSTFAKASISLDQPIMDWLNEEKAKLALPQHLDDSSNPQASRALIQWNPDRVMANMLQEATPQSGFGGLTNTLAPNVITGPLSRKTLDPLLVRLSHSPLLSQPNAFTGTGAIDASSVPGVKRMLQNEPQTRFESIEGEDSVVSNQPVTLLSDDRVDGSQAEVIALTELIQSVKATGLLAMPGEPQIVRNDDGIEMLERLAKDEIPKEAEVLNVRFPRSKRRRKTKRKVLRSESDERPRGRPRKFIRGTEKFWQYQFWQAKLAAVGEENAPPSKEGVMNDPAGLELFESRPNDFDETLVNAKAVGLPVPAAPDEITDDWVRQTQAVLERSDDGAYVTREGMYLGRVKYRSQLLIVRSSRLNSVDWHDRTRTPKFRFITSSAAHSFQYRRYYPQSAETTPQLSRKPKKIKSLIPADGTQKQATVHKAASGSGPQVGVFVESVTTGIDVSKSAEIQNPDLTPGGIFDYNQYMDTTESDSDLESSLKSSNTTARSRRNSPGTLVTTRLSRTPPRGSQSSRLVAGLPRSTADDHRAQPPTLESQGTVFGQKPVEVPRARSDDLASNSGPMQKPMVEVVHDLPSKTTASANSKEPVPLYSNHVINLPAIEYEQECHTSLQLQKLSSTAHSPVVGDVETLDITDASPDKLSKGNPSFTRSNLPEFRSSPMDVSRGRASLPIALNDGVLDESMADGPPFAEPAPKNSNNEKENSDQSYSERHASRQVGANSTIDEPDLQSSPRKCGLSATDSDAFEPQSSVKRQRRDQTGPGVLSQRIIFELVTLANGSAPNNRTTLQRCMANRWQASGGKDRPLMRPIKAAVTNLIDSGKLKEHIFTFRGKGGVTIKRSILHLPSIDAASAKINELKKIIIDADATEYVPQEWAAETLPPPNTTRSRRRTAITGHRPSIQSLPTPEESPQPQETDPTNENAGPVQTPKSTRPRRTPKRRKFREESLASTQEATAEPEPEPDPSPATGFLTLKLRRTSAEPSPPPAPGFLTLRVPGLSNLCQVQEFNSVPQEPSWKALLAPVPLKFNTEASMSDATALPTPASERKSGLRRQPKSTRKDERTRKLVWAPPEQTIPEDLEHLLRLEAINGNGISESDAKDPTAMAFRKIDVVASWEEREAAFLQAKNFGWTFINHESWPDLLDCSNIKAWYLIEFHDDSREVEQECVEFASWDPFVAAQQQRAKRKKKLAWGSRASQESTASAAPARRVTRQATGAVKKRRWTASTDEVETSRKAKRARRASVSIRKDSDQGLRRESDRDALAPPRRAQKKASQAHPPKPRAPLAGKDLESAISIICVRTLTGGIETAVDWRLVLKLFPGKEEEPLKVWWKKISQHYNHDVSHLSEEFQDAYINALERGEAPAVNFDDLYGTDWQEIVKWACSHLDVAKLHESPGRLAPSREKLFDNNDVHVEEVKGLKEIYGYNVTVSNPAKEELYSTVLSGSTASAALCQNHILEADKSELELRDPLFAAARSRIIATLLTHDTALDLQAAEEKLTILTGTAEESEALIKKAMGALQRDKLIIKRPFDHETEQQRSRLGQWQLSDEFDGAFVSRRLVHHSMLKTAATYKIDVLDAAFSRGEEITISKDSMMDDGVMVAVLNLMSQGQIQIRHGVDLPSSRYGVDWENVGYQTKLIGKSEVAFSTILQSTDAYRLGDPIFDARYTTVPCGEIREPRSQVPLWFDINGSLQTERWETVLAAVLGLLSIRPGVNARELAHVFSGALTPWEADLVLQWSKNSGLARQTQSGEGWDTTEWWWMALGNDIEWR